MSKKISGKKSKGQMFLVGAIIIVLVLVLIRTSINVGDVIQRKNFIESGVEDMEFANIRGEALKSAHNSINYTANMANVTNSFLSFAEGKMSARNMRLEGVSVISGYGNLTASTDIPLNVTIYNLFDFEISRAVLNLSTDFGSPVSFGNIPAGSTRSTQFTMNFASDKNLTLWIFYETPTARYVQNVTIPARMGKTKVIPYFDLRLESDRGVLSDRFSETIDVN